MRLAATVWMLGAIAAVAQTAAPAPDEMRRFRRGGDVEETAVVRPDLSADFDAFAPDTTPPPPAPRFDPRRPSLAAEADPLAALIRNGPTGAVLAPSQSPEPWMLPGTRRKPTLADPPPGSAPATLPFKPSARAG